jgi:hypothetical protein
MWGWFVNDKVERIWKEMVINVKTWHLFGTRKTIKMSIRKACTSAEIQTEQLLSTGLQHYCYTNKNWTFHVKSLWSIWIYKFTLMLFYNISPFRTIYSVFLSTSFSNYCVVFAKDVPKCKISQSIKYLINIGLFIMCYITTSTLTFHCTVQYYSTAANHGVYWLYKG